MKYSKNPGIFEKRIAETEEDKHTLYRAALDKYKEFVEWAKSLPEKYEYKVVGRSIEGEEEEIDLPALPLSYYSYRFEIWHKEFDLQVYMYLLDANEMGQLTEYCDFEFSLRGLKNAIREDLQYGIDNGLLEVDELDTWYETVDEDI